MESKNPNVLFSFYTFGNWVFIFCWFSRWIWSGVCQRQGCFFRRLPVSKFWVFGLEEKAPKTNTWVEILALCFPSWNSGTLALCNMQRLFLHVAYYIALDWSPLLKSVVSVHYGRSIDYRYLFDQRHIWITELLGNLPSLLVILGP